MPPRSPPPEHRRRRDGSILFSDHPDFRPNLTPEQCIRAGIFGGVYFNPRGGRPGILGDRVDVDASEFPASWFSGLPRDAYAARRYVASRNRYGVVAGSNQALWESKGWIDARDPRGWFQWYCRFYLGRRCDDDARQIRRWQGVAGVRGRWRNFLVRKISEAEARAGAGAGASVSPVVRQTLLHWAYEHGARG